MAASEELFSKLADALGRPSKAYRAAMEGLTIPGNAIEGYINTRGQLQKLKQPAAIAKLFSATPQGKDIADQVGPDTLDTAFYGANPKEAFDYLGKSTELQQHKDLGMAGINQRDVASKRAFDAAQGRTNAQKTMFAGRDLSSNIKSHLDTIDKLTADQARLATSTPGGIGAIIQQLISKGGDVSQYLGDPRYGTIAAQMKANDAAIKFHQNALTPMYRAQGMIPNNVLDNSDLGAINNPQSSGDSSIPGQSTSGVSIF